MNEVIGLWVSNAAVHTSMELRFGALDCASAICSNLNSISSSALPYSAVNSSSSAYHVLVTSNDVSPGAGTARGAVDARMVGVSVPSVSEIPAVGSETSSGAGAAVVAAVGRGRIFSYLVRSIAISQSPCCLSIVYPAAVSSQPVVFSNWPGGVRSPVYLWLCLLHAWPWLLSAGYLDET